ncbi:MAG TPA: hypothetical protein PKV50_03115 [Prolixibacteraceae bacterium]|nr:hypothetical protein [Prolixibacteraceae bacterium]HUM88494.1 hypothetical protein [Prolixibacteraceae bacterium]
MMGLITPVYKIITPENSSSFENQWTSCLQQLINISARDALNPFRVNVFVKSSGYEDYNAQMALVEAGMKREFGAQCPPFGVVMQEPDDPYLVTLEVGFVEKQVATIEYGQFQQQPYCIVKSDNYQEYWTVGSQVVSRDADISESSEIAFSALNGLYNHLGISFNNTVRQWNYVGEILNVEQIDGRERQHYQMFNEVRSKYYKEYRTCTDFPAATGIGMLHGGVSIDSFSVAGNQHLNIIPISNPVQSESYKYGQTVLVGAPGCSLKQNQPPQFERAKLISLGDQSRLIISGTASIKGQETVGLGDVEEQTRITIENIEALASPENLKRQFPQLGAVPSRYSYIRVYVKHKKDFGKVRNICTDFYGQVPAMYVVADICRDNLLVEIEAELIS